VLSRTTPRMEGVPLELDALCVELLDKEMEGRPKSASAVADRLEAILATMP
jgi:dsRNA-specific ribonuclease